MDWRKTAHDLGCVGIGPVVGMCTSARGRQKLMSFNAGSDRLPCNKVFLALIKKIGGNYVFQAGS